MHQIFIPPTLSPLARAGINPLARINTLRGETMGTTWSVLWSGGTGECQDRIGALRRDIEARLDEVVAQMSSWLPESNLSRFNDAPADSWHELPEPFFTVMQCALQVVCDSGGAYDPSIGALVDLWGFGPTHRSPRRGCLPDARDIANAQACSGWQRIELDAQRRRMRQPGSLRIDLSGIAKGYAVDRVASCLRSLGIHNYLVEIGGELSGQGIRPDGMPWWVELEHPGDVGVTQPAAPRRDLVALHGMAVATSGDYRRYFEHAGQRFAHTIDPRSGWPVSNGISSVTVLHPQCMMADALATALMVMGVEDGLFFAQRQGIAAKFMTRRKLSCDGISDGIDICLSPVLRAMLE